MTEHNRYPVLRKIIAVRGADGYTFPVYLPGPAGSGKTTATQHLARDLQVPWHHNGAIDADWKLLGFVDAAGRYHATPFRAAYEQGGVFLFDEIDASNPAALVALNAALENQTCVFPDATITRHPDCHIIAAANTAGGGATFDYVARNKLDAATLDRFIFIEWPIDETLEAAAAGNDGWVKQVRTLRAGAEALPGLRHLITPRASIRGAALLAAGIDKETVLECCVRKGLTEQQWTELLQKAVLG